MNVYLAIDLGAGSGRIMAVVLEAGRLRLTEVHRFQSAAVSTDDGLIWDLELIWREVRRGLRKAAEKFGPDVQSIGVDSWGVDYAWIDPNGDLIPPPFSYRDPRHDGLMEELVGRWGREWIFERTGIQFMPINSLYQWAADLRDRPEVVRQAKRFLLIADILSYWLTGRQMCERSNASTTQLYDPQRRTWSHDLAQRLGLPLSVLPPLCDPGTLLGPLKTALSQETGLPPVPVVAVGSHDTASAVAGVPASSDRFAYLSCGTWALLGTELEQPRITPEVLRHNFTNETGVDGTFRLLKNITGLWIIQECRRQWEEEDGAALAFADLAELTAAAPSGKAFIDPDADAFRARGNQPEAIRRACVASGQPAPQRRGEVLRVALESLALKVHVTLDQLEALLGEPLEVLHVIGGGTQDPFLMQCIANATRRPVVAGPVEATAFGNALAQMRAQGTLLSLQDGRTLLRESIATTTYAPAESWDSHRERFRSLLAK